MKRFYNNFQHLNFLNTSCEIASCLRVAWHPVLWGVDYNMAIYRDIAYDKVEP